MTGFRHPDKSDTHNHMEGYLKSFGSTYEVMLMIRVNLFMCKMDTMTLYLKVNVMISGELRLREEFLERIPKPNDVGILK